jgi:hypothetical protein
MMMNKIEKLASKFNQEGEKTFDFFSQLDEEVWSVQLYSDGAEWTILEVLAHIVDTEAALLPLFENISQGGGGLANKIDIDEYNAKSVAEMADLSPKDLLAEFGSRREMMADFVSKLSENDLDLLGRHPFLGETTLGEMLRLFYLHVNLHIRDIRAVLGK